MNEFSLEEISAAGEKYYLETLKDELEKDHLGEYAVIDVENRKYAVDADRFEAIKKAQAQFGQKLFYIVQIGMIKKPTNNFVTKKHAWVF